MVGLGETDAEVTDAMRQLRGADVDMLTLGQYLAPGTTGRAVPAGRSIRAARTIRRLGRRSARRSDFAPSPRDRWYEARIAPDSCWKQARSNTMTADDAE